MSLLSQFKMIHIGKKLNLLNFKLSLSTSSDSNIQNFTNIITQIQKFKMKNDPLISQEQKQKKRNEFRKHLSINTIMSIPLLSINFFESIFLLIWTFLEITMLIYKNQKYPLPTYAVNIEGGIIGMFILTQVIRYLIIEKAIMDKSTRSVVFYIVLTLFILPQYVFFLRLQTYALLIQVVINWIGIGFNVMQIIIALWVWKVFQRKKSIS